MMTCLASCGEVAVNDMSPKCQEPAELQELTAQGPTIYPKVTVLLGDPRLPDLSKRDGKFHEEDFSTRDALKAAFATLPDYSFRYLDDHTTILDDLRADPPHFVVNFCDTGFCNDPYRGAQPPRVSRNARRVLFGFAARGHGVFLGQVDRVRGGRNGRHRSAGRNFGRAGRRCSGGAALALSRLHQAAYGDGSVTKDAIVRDRGEGERRVRAVQAEFPGRAVLVQEFLSGAEYGVGIIGNPGQHFTVLPPLEVDYEALDPSLPRLLGFESKAIPDSPYWSQIRFRAARLDTKARAAIESVATTMFMRLGLRDYGRFDFRADAEGRIKFMECNTNPAWAYDGTLAFMAGFAGLDYAGMLHMTLRAAQSRAAKGRGAMTAILGRGELSPPTGG